MFTSKTKAVLMLIFWLCLGSIMIAASVGVFYKTSAYSHNYETCVSKGGAYIKVGNSYKCLKVEEIKL